MALGRSQTEPQAPQLVTRARLTSQPSAALPLQSAKPSLQDAMAQAPVVHTGVALARAQALPQAPQWETSPPGVVSPPLETSASQSAKPALQVPTAQAPARQAAVALGTTQAFWQSPQWATSVAVSTSQPSWGTVLQLARAMGHAMVEQAPRVQVLRWPSLETQALPGAPQLSLLLRRSSQPSARSLLASAHPARQVKVQVPVAQDATELGTAAQATPHAPQWRVVVRAVSQPSRSSLLQLPKPVAQAERSQTPARQAAAAWSRTQAVPSGAVVGLEQRPLVGSQTPATVHAWRDARQITPAHSQASPWPSRSESRWSALACAGQLSSQSKTPSPSPSTAGRSMRNLICNTVPLRRGVKLTVSTERNSCWLRTTSTSAKPSSRVPPRVSPGAPRVPRSAAAGTNTRTRYRALSLRRRFWVFQST